MTDRAAQDAKPRETAEPEPVELVLLDGAGALAQINRAEIDIQIATAKRYPRSVSTFKKQVLELATLDEDTAASMFYVLERSGKAIEGPSVRLAEIVASTWTNIRSGARVVEIDDKFITAQGAAFDLQSNHAVTVEVKRRITDKYGRRYNEDMIGVTSQAAMSIALRNAIFRVVPFAFVKEAYEQARETAVGKAMTMEQRRTKAMSLFAKVGVKPERVLSMLGRGTLDDVTLEDVIKLRGIFTAIKDGETTVDESFPAATAGETPKTLADLTAKAAAGKAEAASQPNQPKEQDASAGTPLAATSAASATVALRLKEIQTEVDVRGIKKAIVEHLFKKHLGTADMSTMPHDAETFAKLGRVLTEVRGIPAQKT